MRRSPSLRFSEDFSENVRRIFLSFAQKNFERKSLELNFSQKCDRCFFFRSVCICHRIKTIFSKTRHESKAKISVFMHHKEWGRSSNTGKLIPIGMPQKSLLGIYGVADSERRLLESVLASNSLILYPSPSSKSIVEYREWYMDSTDVTLCVLDSTWSQSAAMNKILPSHIPRVRVDDYVTAPSQFLNRKQSTVKGRVSTIESVALALTALGEIEETTSPLYQALRLSVDTVLRQNGRAPAYDSFPPAR